MRNVPATYPARPLLAGLGACALLVAAGCGSESKPERPDGALTVYSSLPRQGISAQRAHAVGAGARLALADAGGRAGGRRVRLVELDSSGDGDAPWDPAAVEENARRAAGDRSAIAYIGELELGASAVSVPVTDSNGLLQVSPADGLPSLTQEDPGGSGEGPARYYPKGRRTFIRLVPHDGNQARLLVDEARRRGAKRVTILRDDRVSGRELASWALDAMGRMKLNGEVEEARKGADPEDVARRVAEKRPDAVIYTGIAGEPADLLLAALARALPSAQLLASSALAAAPPPGARVDLLEPTAPAREYPPAARRLLRRIAERGGMAEAPPEALYGYEAMKIVLDAIAATRAGPGDRDAVTRAALRPRRRRAAYGSYVITAGGDVATSTFGAYRAEGGRLRFLGFRNAAGVALSPEPRE
jgi:branched-chain amino acid transport system substrate-binding protein